MFEELNKKSRANNFLILYTSYKRIKNEKWLGVVFVKPNKLVDISRYVEFNVVKVFVKCLL